MNGQYELDSLESGDAEMRYHEGGGNLPLEWQAKAVPQALNGLPGAGTGLGQVPQSVTPWYRSPTFLAIAAVGAVAMLAVWYNAKSAPALSAELDADTDAEDDAETEAETGIGGEPYGGR